MSPHSPRPLAWRTGFTSVAREYDEHRFGYPEELFDELVSHTGPTSGAQALEIGPGTGQATVPLARRGVRITAVELGREMAALLSAKTENQPGVEVLNEAFEDVALPPESFDLVFAATAFHWIAPEVRFAKPHALLRADGHLAVIDTVHVSDESGDHFFHASQPWFRRFTGQPGELPELPTVASLEPAELDDQLFSLRHFAAFVRDVRFTGAEFAALNGTYSPALALSEPDRSSFLSGVQRLIDDDFGGSIIRRFALTLTIAARVGSTT